MRKPPFRRGKRRGGAGFMAVPVAGPLAVAAPAMTPALFPEGRGCGSRLPVAAGFFLGKT